MRFGSTLSSLPARLLVGLALVGSLFAACVVDGLDVTGKACPCPSPSEYSCDAKTMTCVKSAATSATVGSTTTGASSTSGMGGSSSASTSSTGAAGGSGGSVTACKDVCGTADCGACPTTAAVAVDAFDIDATEVTRGQYQAFLDVHYDFAKQDSVCLWNKSYAVLDNDAPSGCDMKFDPVTFPNRPVTCIDWCDAAAYCAWAGRHLCGRIGGGVLQSTDSSDPSKSQWQRACTQAGAHLYPYGDTFDGTKCNDLGGGHGGVVTDVGSLPDCVGGYPGLFDMSGNVEEWESSCNIGVDPNDPSDDSCALRGGAYWSDASDAACAGLKYYAPRKRPSNDWGFRCCGK